MWGVVWGVDEASQGTVGRGRARDMHMSAGTARGEGKGGSGVWCWRCERQRRSVGRAPGGVEHGRWERHAGGVVGSERTRGAGRAGARQGRRCLAAAGLTSARRLPRADTRPTGMFLSHLDGGGASPVWGAVQRRGMCRPPCPALLHGRTPRSRWHGGREIWADAPRVRRAGWPWAAVLWVRAVAGGRQTQPSRPQPAADTLSERHHATAPGHPAPRVRRRVARAVRGWEMAIRDGKHWRAGAGHGGVGMARWRRVGWRGQAGAHCRVWRLGGRSVGATSIPRPASRHQQPAPPTRIWPRIGTHLLSPHASPHRPARARGQRPVWRRRLARGRGRSEQRGS